MPRLNYTNGTIQAKIESAIHMAGDGKYELAQLQMSEVIALALLRVEKALYNTGGVFAPEGEDENA